MWIIFPLIKKKINKMERKNNVDCVELAHSRRISDFISFTNATSSFFIDFIPFRGAV